MKVQRFIAWSMSACLAAGALAVVLAATDSKTTSKKPQTRSSTKSKTAPQTQTAPGNQPVQTKGGVTVRENYFMELPGLDLSTLTPKQRQHFLDRVNTEICNCGCPNDTIARCYVNDPKCRTVKGLAEKVLEEVKSGK